MEGDNQEVVSVSGAHSPQREQAFCLFVFYNSLANARTGIYTLANVFFTLPIRYFKSGK